MFDLWKKENSYNSSEKSLDFRETIFETLNNFIYLCYDDEKISLKCCEFNNNLKKVLNLYVGGYDYDVRVSDNSVDRDLEKHSEEYDQNYRYSITVTFKPNN